MKRINFIQKKLLQYRQKWQSNRTGGILVLAAFMLVIVFAFAAFTVEYGMIAVTQGQLQNASDAASHAAMLEYARSIGPDAEISNDEGEDAARESAVDMINRFRTGNAASTHADAEMDVRFGTRTWSEGANSWVEDWSSDGPFNMVEVTPRKVKERNTELPMTFGRVLGVDGHELERSSVAAVVAADGFKMRENAGQWIGILPIAVDLGTWEKLVNANTGGSTTGFSDNYSYEGGTSIDTGSDGIRELNIYPDLNTSLPPGNRGTVDLGSPNNSTNDLKRQIVSGLNSFDLSFFPNGEIHASTEKPLLLNGDPGISAGIENSLQSIIGQSRAIPIFTQVTGPGNNATYTVVKFVGVRILHVNLSGGPKKRSLMVQPATFESPHIIRGTSEITYDSIISKPFLIR